ncbi:MAG: hypothetical protein M3209_17845 [Acidobacteriota bacterium]|nr:hypothetical protein [Acidobacteriota bacterium]
MSQDFEETFERLRVIFKPLENDLAVKTNEPGKYHHVSKKLSEKKQAIWFGGVEVKKNYVSFHLIPIYVFPELLSGISPELKKRLTGKSCFNFKEPDEAVFADLENLTKAGFEAFKQKDMI